MAKEKRLIDANALIKQFDGYGWGGECDGETVLEAVADAPTVDAVEVVRCKDCKYAYINSFSAASGVAVCKHWSNEAKTAIMQQDDFCSYGERKDNG